MTCASSARKCARQADPGAHGGNPIGRGSDRCIAGPIGAATIRERLPVSLCQVRPYATRRKAFRFHIKTRFASSSAPLARSCAVRSTDFTARPSCRDVCFAWSRTAARRCFPRSGSRKNIKPLPKPIPAIPAMRPVLPCIGSSPFQNLSFRPGNNCIPRVLVAVSATVWHSA